MGCIYRRRGDVHRAYKTSLVGGGVVLHRLDDWRDRACNIVMAKCCDIRVWKKLMGPVHLFGLMSFLQCAHELQLMEMSFSKRR